MKAKLHLLTALAAALTTIPAIAADEGSFRKTPSLNAANPSPVRPIPPLQTTTFLGVVTFPLPPVLSAQLGLPDGFGIFVDEILPDSPAETAGVQRFDVLRQFNDQSLTSAQQLSALVRDQAKDAEVSLTLLRKGQEQKVAVKLAERPLPARMQFPAPAGEIRGQVDRLREGFDDRARRLQEQTNELQNRVQEYQGRLKKWQAEPRGEMPKPPEFRPSVEPADILREIRPGGAAQVRLLEPNGTVTYNTANAKVLMKDESGEIEVSSNDGRRKLLAKNAKGEVIFDGPIDTPEQIKALPEELRKKVEVIEVRTKVESIPALPPPLPEARRELQ